MICKETKLDPTTPPHKALCKKPADTNSNRQVRYEPPKLIETSKQRRLDLKPTPTAKPNRILPPKSTQFSTQNPPRKFFGSTSPKRTHSEPEHTLARYNYHKHTHPQPPTPHPQQWKDQNSTYHAHKLMHDAGEEIQLSSLLENHRWDRVVQACNWKKTCLDIQANNHTHSNKQYNPWNLKCDTKNGGKIIRIHKLNLQEPQSHEHGFSCATQTKISCTEATTRPPPK